MSAAMVAIVLAGAGSYALRASFLAAARRLVDLPPLTERILRQIPPAVLAALVLPALVRPGGDLDLWQPRLLAGVVAAVVSWRTRNVGLTLAVGMVLLFALEQVT
jgi:branched-subunit amino acid transport protein